MSLDLGLVLKIIVVWVGLSILIALGFARWMRYQKTLDEIDSRENKL
jgi:hypothetical protein